MKCLYFFRYSVVSHWPSWLVSLYWPSPSLNSSKCSTSACTSVWLYLVHLMDSSFCQFSSAMLVSSPQFCRYVRASYSFAVVSIVCMISKNYSIFKVNQGGTGSFYVDTYHYNSNCCTLPTPHLHILNWILHLESHCATPSSHILNYLIPFTPTVQIIFHSPSKPLKMEYP